MTEDFLRPESAGETRVATTTSDIDVRTQREVANLKEIIWQRYDQLSAEIDGRFEGARRELQLLVEASQEGKRADRLLAAERIKVIEARLDGIDRANIVLQETVTRVPTDVQLQVGNLRDVMEERFNSIDKQFSERDIRSEREARDNKVAVDAAFAAQKDAACLLENSKVLCADLIWRRAGDLRVGDELVAFDEKPVEEGPGRRYRKATVTENSLRDEPILRIYTADGSVGCTHDHPWLVKNPHQQPRWIWRRACELRPGDHVLRMLDVWEVDRSYEAGWLAGILDGEGCLHFPARTRGRSEGARLSIGQVHGPLADQIDVALDAQGVAVSRHTRAAQPYTSGGLAGKAQAQRRWSVDRRPDIMRLLGSLRPVRMMVHADEVWEGFSIKARDRACEVVAVDDAGVGTIAALGTSTCTYIGEGFAMHNTQTDIANAKAIEKSENATTKTIDTLGEVITSSNKALSDKIDDLKSRVGQIEALAIGSRQNAGDRRADISTTTAILGAVVAVVIVALALYAALHK